MTKYILGGGITGLIWAFYNPQYTIISPDIGGQMTSDNFSLGPRFLIKTEYTEKLLKDLNIQAPIKTFKIGYCKNNIVGTAKELNITEEDRKNYFLKSRGLKNINEVPITVMNSFKDEIVGFDVEWNEIIKKLSEKVKIINNKIIKINTNEKILVSGGNDYDYDELISTIHASLFFKLIFYDTSAKKCENNCKDITYVAVKNKSLKTVFNYIYVIDDSFPFYRMTFQDNVVIYEFIGKPSEKDLPDHDIIGIKTVYGCKIIKDLNLDGIPEANIKFVGRYAQLNHSIKTEQVTEMAIKNVEQKQRISLDSYYMSVARVIALRGTCLRKRVGAIIVVDNKIIATGYNGAPKGFKHCTEVRCNVVNNHCIRTVHAEENALLQAGEKAKGGILYTTVSICVWCFKSAVQAGIKKIVV